MNNKIKKGIKLLLILIIFGLILLKGNAIAASLEVKVTQSNTDNKAIVKIESDKTIYRVRIYKKNMNGKYILFYKAEVNSKKAECAINNVFLSETEETIIKVVAETSSGVSSVETRIEKIPPRSTPTPTPTPTLTPTPTSTPTSTPTPAPTRTPTPTATPAPTHTPTPTSTSTPVSIPTVQPIPKPSVSPTSTGPQPGSGDSNVYKILFIGNSYAYFNDLGGILAELGKLTNKQMIVVYAGHGGVHADYFATKKLSSWYWDNRGSKTKVVGEVKGPYDKTLKQILSKDWANLNRGGQWDYIFMINNITGNDNMNKTEENYGVKYDRVIFDMVKGTISNADRFSILSGYYHDTDGTTRLKVHKKAASGSNYGFSVLNLTGLYSQYSKTRSKVFCSTDGPRHPTAKAQYLTAVVMYAKIFGRDNLASSPSASNFIPLYNKSGGLLKNVIASTSAAHTRYGRFGYRIRCKEITIDCIQ